MSMINGQFSTVDRALKIADRVYEAVSMAALTLVGYLSSLYLSFTVNRLFVCAMLLPLYLWKFILSCIPSFVENSVVLLAPEGLSRLIQDAELYRSRSDSKAQSQFDGTYLFKTNEIFHVEKDSRGWMASLPWENDTHEFTVCGGSVRYIHLKPSYSSIAQDTMRTHRPVVFLHGSTSWSYMWRNVFPHLLEQGHDIYALDWLGHGRSDKILRPECINFELHIRTLVSFFEVTGLQHAIVAAHDWGGCIALSTLPRLPSTTCDSLLLLNSFLPPRPTELSLHNALLYTIWSLTTSLLNGYLPSSTILRFAAPHLPKSDITAYAAPYAGLHPSTKSTITRFSHMAPITPRRILTSLRNSETWKFVEALCGPQHFDDLNAQARLAAHDVQIRQWWGSKGEGEGWRQFKMAVVCGDRDPLLLDAKRVLVGAIDSGFMVKWAPRGMWLGDSGHFPVEERPADVGRLIARFAREETREKA